MKNYLSKHYQHYYIQTADGQSVETIRAECFAPSESPSAENPYKQRWFYDAEQFSYIIRLPRNEQGEELYRMNATSVKREERYTARKYACILKGTGDCDNDCNNCQRKRYSRIVELDKPLSYDDCGEPLYLEIAVTDKYMDEENESKKEESDTLHIAISQLEKEQQTLIKLFYFKQKTQKEIALILGKDQSRISRQLKIAVNNLKKLLEK